MSEHVMGGALNTYTRSQPHQSADETYTTKHLAVRNSVCEINTAGHFDRTSAANMAFLDE